MANVWKIGSRWSDDGNKNSSILSIFRRNNIVFTGRDNDFDFKGKVKHGDYFAIADGITVVAVAKVISDIPFQIDKSKLRFRSTDFRDIQEEKDLSYAYGVHVKIIDLDMSQWFYQKQGSFFHTNEETSEKVICLFENDLSTKFDIISKTYRLFSEPNRTDGKESIISRNHYYTIPVYQREYSWQQEHIIQLVNDIFTGFWGTDEREIVREPLFLGTMQLSYKKYIKEGEYEQDVIDGQQRLSTLLCLIKYLQLKFPDNDYINAIQTNWLETRVNNGKEEEYLEEMLGLTSLNMLSNEQTTSSNAYLRNLCFINNCFDESLNKDDKTKKFFEDNINEFISYLLNDVYMVIVETIAGLSKTIKIFNTINTAGLDLNGDDLFKVRFYEYLRDTNKYGEDAFDKISNIYKKVKDKNTEWRVNHGYDIITMEMVRSVYKLYLISKYGLPLVLYSKSTDTFFTELFDVLLKVQKHKDVNNIGKLEMDLKDLNRIVDTIILWNTNTRSYSTSDQLITQYLIDYSRYERYGNIAYLLLLNNEHISNAEERINSIYKVLRILARYFFIKSIEYSKVIYLVHSFMYELYRATFHKSQDEILKILCSELDSCNFDDFSSVHLKKDIVERATWKNLICLLSAYLDEVESNTSIVEMNNLFTWGYFDIEHIHATANTEENDGITPEEQNSIGNLMLLEQSINRSIGDLSFEEKRHRSGGNVCYEQSKYATVRKICQKQTWGRDVIIQRRDEESQRIIDFLNDYKN